MSLLLYILAKVLILWIICGVQGASAANKYNVSLLEMATCKEYDLRSGGYKYSDFFHVHSLDNNKASEDKLLHLKFYVLTSMDAHILLSVTAYPGYADRVYEIVIGAGGNTFSAIRTIMGRRRVATNSDDRILSVLDPTPIEVMQMKDGNLLVNIPGHKTEPLLNFTDASPLNINYVSFSTFGSISARWFYDCGFDGFANEMEKEVKPMSPRQSLIANLTTWSENATLPNNLNSIDFYLQIKGVSYKQDHSLLRTRLDLLMSWEDPRLEWFPYEFQEIDTIVESDLEIWRPTLIVLNGAFQSIGHLKFRPEFRVLANGRVYLIARNIEVVSWCLNPNRNWPHEAINCEISLGLNEFDAHGTKQLQLNYTKMDLLNENEEITTYTEWAVERLEVFRFFNSTTARYAPKGSLQAMDGDLSVGIKIARNSNFYKNVFTMPILTAHSLFFLSFILRGYRRGALILVVFVVLILGLMFLTRHANPAYVPSIMSAYQYNLYIAVYCYLLHIIIIWLELYPPKEKPSGCIVSFVNWSPLRLMLCMRFADSADYLSIQEYPWREFSKMLNNLNLIVVNVMLLIVNLFLLPKF